MQLARVLVVREANDHDGTLIHCFDGRELVLGLVDRTGLNNYFHWPKAARDEGRVSLRKCHLVAEQNLALIGPILDMNYQRGEFEMLHRFGSSLKLVRITEPELKGADAPSVRWCP
jgi:hypothetical protein